MPAALTAGLVERRFSPYPTICRRVFMRQAMVLGLAGAFLLALAPASSAQVAAKPLATGPTNWDGVTIDLMSVERKGSVLTVKWAVRNAGAKEASVQFTMTGSKQTTYVVDEESGTKYYALTDKEKNTLASEHVYTGDGFGINDDVEPGATSRYWAKYPAPPPAVKTINIFFTNTDPFEGIAITDK
jgi:hypothetical protein